MIHRALLLSLLLLALPSVGRATPEPAHPVLAACGSTFRTPVSVVRAITKDLFGDKSARVLCALTPRMIRRIMFPRWPVRTVELCRCTVIPRVDRIYQLARSGNTAQVNVLWDTLKRKYTTTFVTKRAGGAGWLVDDQYCAGRPSTSLYRGPGTVCP